VRVIAGRYRGRRLTTVRDLSVRPAADRVKQTIFDMLATRVPLDGARVLDLFAGSGSLGIEALSRGASHTVFVEAQRAAADSIRANLAALGCAADATVVVTDALRYIRTESASFDVIFADPPYAWAGTPELPEQLLGRGLLRAGGYLLIEHAAGLSFPAPVSYRQGPVKRFGRTVVSFFRTADAPAAYADDGPPTHPPSSGGHA
jgi:16S rRNA (guanine966-N2)-methyltransferase